MKHHVMKDPSDLDPFQPDQVQMTQAMSEEFFHQHLSVLQQILAAIQMNLQQVPLFVWQRIVFELHAKAVKGEYNAEGMRDILWAYVKLMQEGHDAAEKAMRKADQRSPLFGEIQDLLKQQDED